MTRRPVVFIEIISNGYLLTCNGNQIFFEKLSDAFSKIRGIFDDEIARTD